jgi:hypothetical protein
MGKIPSGRSIGAVQLYAAAQAFASRLSHI